MVNEKLPKEIKGFARFTLNARKVINRGYSLAVQYKHQTYEPIHLFLALLQEKDGVIQTVLEKLGIDTDVTAKQFSIELMNKKGINTFDNVEPVFAEITKKIINEGIIVASELGHVYVGSEHLLVAFFKFEEIDFLNTVKSLGISQEVLKETLMTLNPFPITVGAKDEQDELKGYKSSLPYFCVDMNEKSSEGSYPNITGRDKEIKRLIHILSRKTKNNPILVGDAGVGKTAIVEGFVNMLVDKNVPSSFFNKRVLSLDVAGILSGARLRGDVEERIKSVIEEAIADENVIIFIDEIHTIVGAGSVGNKDSLDIANILKPYLTGGELSIIGATTHEEYSKYFEDDAALARRFQSIIVNELDIESSKKVILNIKDDFENFHKIKISAEAVDAAVELTKKFITDRFLPDKAIDVLDEAAATLKIGREIAIEPELSELGEKLINIQKKKNSAIKNKNFELAAKAKQSEDDIIVEIEQIIEGKKKVSKKYAKVVSESLVRDIIYKATQIPMVISDIGSKELKDLAKNIKKRIVGQDRVVDNVGLIIQKSHLGLNDPKRPLASFLFMGPTGVGKTELAKSLAKELFGSVDLLYQINMSELMEMHSVSKLIGSPPGYVGYQEGGQLTDYVKRKPYSVILFDEIEKAHPDTLNLLLQILDEGELTDSKGVKVNFRNCIIIMTSNIGAEEVSSDNKLGFDVQIEDEEEKEVTQAYEDMKDKIMDELRRSLRPEFLNRIDLIDVFRGLNKKDCLGITQLEVDELKLRLIKAGIIMEVSPEIIEKINNEGYSKEFGGRHIRRKVQEILENGLAKFLLDSNIKKKKDLIKVDVNLVKDTVKFSMTK